MATATKQAKKKAGVAARRQAWGKTKQGVDVRESLLMPAIGENTVDVENAVIRGVKVLSRHSPNRHGMPGVDGTDYEPSAQEQLMGILKGGIEVNVGHPPKDQPDQERPPEARNGKLFNPRIVGNETYADWKLLKSHPMTARILESANDPELHDQFALSINARGYGTVKNRRYCITEFLPTPSSPDKFIRSVDLVTRGGANRNLFENRETHMKKPFKQFIAAAPEAVQARWAKVGELAKAANLLEMYEDMGDTAIEPPAEAPMEGGAAGEMDGGWEDACAKLIHSFAQDIASGKLTADEGAKKIAHAVKLFKDEEDDSGPPAEGAADTEEGDESGDDEKEQEEKEAMESAEKAELTQLREEKRVRDLCESLEFTPTSLQIEAMVGLKTVERRKALIAEFKGTKAKKANHPRTASGRDVTESRQTSNTPNYGDRTEEGRKARIALLKR